MMKPMIEADEKSLKFIEILESTTDAFYAVDPNWKLIYINHRTEEYWHRKREEILGAVLWDLFPEDKTIKGYKVLMHAMKERIPVCFETFSPTLLTWVEVNIYPMSNGGLSVYFRDITQRKQAEEALLKSEERFRALVTASSDVLYRMSPDWNIMWQLQSDGFLANTEKPNCNWLDYYIHPDDQGYVSLVIKKAIKEKSIFELEHRVKKADGSLGWTFSRAIPLLNAQGEIEEWFGAARDITERKEMEEKLEYQRYKMLLAEKEKIEALEKVIEMKDEFLSMISHEFKTPLNVMLSAIQAMKFICKNELSDKANVFLDKILQNSNRQLKLVNNILDLTRINADHLKVRTKNVDIVYLTKIITESIMIYAEQKNISVFFTSTLSKKVIGIDEEKYERILLNLLSNAVKFTPNGNSIRVKVSQKIVNGSCKVCIQVIDEGIGIPIDKQKFIFEKFGQVDSSLSRQAEGTGIGLSLVKVLTELLDGEISLESKIGRGSTFRILLPITRVKEDKLEKQIPVISDNRLIQAAMIEFSDVY